MKICKIDGCKKYSFKGGFCRRHYNQVRQYGKAIGNEARSKFDPNEFIMKKDICRIKLYNERGYEKGETVIDKADFNLVKDRKWVMSTTTGYIISGSGERRLTLHHVIFGRKPPKGWDIDHRDVDKLNNRRRNLRLCTRSQTNMNKGLQSNNTTGFKGVFWYKKRHKWAVQIWANKQSFFIGYFDSKIEAAVAYNKAALKYHGEFARLNEIP